MAHKLIHGTANMEGKTYVTKVELDDYAFIAGVNRMLSDMPEDQSAKLVFMQPNMQVIEGLSPNTMTRNKMLLECFVHMLNTLSSSMKETYREDASTAKGFTVHGIHKDQLLAIQKLSATLNYMVNTLGWASGCPYPSDTREIVSQLKYLIFELEKTQDRSERF